MNSRYLSYIRLKPNDMKTTILLLLLSISASAQVYIPDNKFKLELLWNDSINTTLDTEISYQEAENYTGIINIYNKGITDITGLEAFTSITEFNCVDNDISSIDVTNNLNLVSLKIDNNNISELDISNNIFLETVTLGSNSIQVVDASNNTLLTFFTCYNNGLKYLDIRNGNNVNMDFGVTANPDLCISVDDVDYSNSNWGDFKDVTATFNADCSVGIEEKKIVRNTAPIVFDILGRNINKPNYNYIIIIK